ncbi:type II secretion system F family protein [Spongiactinospora sp. TRM90649]|uniref:type II secretion system F family protein n=1 Tax=Spongiactinospora sp. TRM90649 TaxID=3031114 RepID=UPI0023F9E6CF|nr:type II secretion system F family protein [Spongiactinospora sp. TRM90649]MDF5754867.1 type II secretion system F family protein [Spongiactinospora sp. TRM90649]
MRLPFVARLVPGAGQGKRAELWRTACLELCQGLGAELAAGRTPSEALSRVAAWVRFPEASAGQALEAAARDGGDVPGVLAAIAPEDGGEGLRGLAACWRVSTGVGASLSTLVDRVETGLRAAQTHRQDTSAQLAGPRATARLLAALPLLGLLMATGLGMNPLAFLFGDPIGLATLAAGLSLNACGLWWTGRLVARAERA